MGSLDGEHFDCVVIGAGMGGLAAAIRLCIHEKRVLVLERHNAIGGLNSFYSIDGRKYDVGLHALTNYVDRGQRGALHTILRQMRIKRDDWDLAPQRGSKVAFPDVELKFSNDRNLIVEEVASQFPDQVDGFRKLCAQVDEEFGRVAHEREEISARTELRKFVTDPLLEDMILLPVMAYGSSQEHDMDWVQFVNLFKSVFLEGFARPYEGVRQILRVMRQRLKELGGVRKMKCGVKKIVSSNGSVQELILDDDSVVKANHVLSTAGWVETLRMCSDQPFDAMAENEGCITFTETISVLKEQPRDLGWDDTIIFFSDRERIDFSEPKDLVNPHLGVVCLPNNYEYSEGRQLDEGFFRISALANYKAWAELEDSAYQAQKSHWFNKLQKTAMDFLPELKCPIEDVTVARDMFTPRTVRKYTNHVKGAVYGSPRKNRRAMTHLDNLYITGTDQGMLGIVGAMMSGISVANNCVLMGRPV